MWSFISHLDLAEQNLMCYQAGRCSDTMRARLGKEALFFPDGHLEGEKKNEWLFLLSCYWP